MKQHDRELGMDRPITRRDFLNGVGVAAASTVLPGRALAEQALERSSSAASTNRWAHGYASFYFPRDGSETPNMIGRKRFGRIAIANSDAGARPNIDCAIYEAHRAVEELAS